MVYSLDKVIYEPNHEHPDLVPPWLTGPLLAPASEVAPLGHYNVEPYVYATAITGLYNSAWKAVDRPIYWENSLQISTQIGLTSWMDIQLNPTLYWNYSQGRGNWAFGDLPVQLDVQLYLSEPSQWAPSVKLSLKETFPTGKYRNLNQALTDMGGGGSWNSAVILVVGKLFHLSGVHYFNSRLSLQYSLPSPVQIQGFNAYGGGEGAKAKFFPAQNLQADLGVEFTLAQTWALALDIVGTWSGKSHYSGFAGIGVNNAPATLGTGSSVQYSLAPALEYNWSPNFGIIGGVWFTIGGRNSQVFASGVFAANYYY